MQTEKYVRFVYMIIYLFKNLNKYILKLNKTNTNNNSLNNETRERNYFYLLMHLTFFGMH